jgi:hypothetical protein
MSSAPFEPGFNGTIPRSEMTVMESEREVQHLLDALEDPECRQIIEATTDEALTTREISMVCNLPLSTTYRKIELLTEASLLKENTRIHLGGKHASEYTRLLDDVVISVDGSEGIQFSISRRHQVERHPIFGNPLSD